MSLFDEPPVKKAGPAAISIGDDLSRLSEDELVERLSALEAEIARTIAERDARRGTRAAADALFKK